MAEISGKLRLQANEAGSLRFLSSCEEAPRRGFGHNRPGFPGPKLLDRFLTPIFGTDPVPPVSLTLSMKLKILSSAWL